ncbi:hypothetical protein SK128_026067 [Halocaridina rubra]|uniref:Uncharacterized protein n=1 Tax=Halocaridina rubra TaxID=373956 RepID=A0AAN8XIF6_HALRR
MDVLSIPQCHMDHVSPINSTCMALTAQDLLRKKIRSRNILKREGRRMTQCQDRQGSCNRSI